MNIYPVQVEVVHFKGGRYMVKQVHILEDTSKEIVLYEALDGENKGRNYIRHKANFIEPVLWPDGVMRPRFIPVEGEWE